MKLDYIEMKKTENIKSLEIPDKEKYLWDLLNVENNYTGRMDVNFANVFILEASQLITNSIFVFEQGYFDCAFYSLRQALEISTVMVYLADLEGELKENELKKWKEKSRFPMYKQMMSLLEKNDMVFSDIKEQMKDYFEEVEKTKNLLNKYVHKQGFDTFYISRSHPLTNYNDDLLEEDFEKYLKTCIGALAVFRLTIDPFPILLMDPEIYHRTGDEIPKQYSEEFVEKYIGKQHIKNYKNTSFYQNHYNSIISAEKKDTSVSAVVKNQYIDKEKIPEILKQSHLLHKHDFIAVVLAGFSPKVSKMHFGNGMWFYLTSTNSDRKEMNRSGLRFKKFLDSGIKYNNEYDVAYISVLKVYGDNVFVEHNGKLDEKEINELEGLVKLLEEKCSTT